VAKSGHAPDWLAIEARVLCLEWLKSIILATPSSSRQRLLAWMSRDFFYMAGLPDEVINDEARWDALIDLDPRKADHQRD